MRAWTIFRPAIFMMAFCAAGFAFGQAAEGKPALDTFKTRLIHVKYADPEQLQRVLLPFERSGKAAIVPNREFRTLTLSGSPDVLAAIEAMISELDVAPPRQKSIEVTAYLLTASPAAPGNSTFPPALDAVMKQLRATFQYKSYELLDTILIRSLAGQEGSTMGVVGFHDSSGPGQSGNYFLKYDAATASQDPKGTLVRLKDLRLTLERPKVTKEADGSTRSGNQVAGFTTSVDIREGQMAVVGKTSLEAGDRAIITVLSVKVIE